MRSQYFPWQLFKNFWLVLAALINLTFLSALALAYFLFDFQLYVVPTLILLLGVFVFSLVLSALLAYRAALPLRRVILKAMRLVSKKQSLVILGDDETDSADLLESEPGEYFELERALQKIDQKLKRRKLELAHERQESQALMSFLQDAVVSVGRDGHINYFNSRFAMLFLDSGQVKDPAGTSIAFLDLFRDPDLIDRLKRCLQMGSVERFQARYNIKLDRTLRDFAMTVSPLREEKDREIYGAILLFSDISDLVKAEKIRAEFVENASHELRTPLTSLKGFVEMAKEDLDAGQTRLLPEYMMKISRSVDRMSELVGDMLTLSTLEQMGGLRLELVNPGSLTNDVFERLMPLALEKKIVLKIRDQSQDFRADGRLVERVLENLIGNAIKYTQIGGWIEVTWTLSEDQRTIQLNVKDNGPGISAEHLDRLFERFYRVDKGRSRDQGGTGLGLAIVKHILQLHNGSVGVKTSLGEGAEFICQFPARL